MIPHRVQLPVVHIPSLLIARLFLLAVVVCPLIGGCDTGPAIQIKGTVSDAVTGLPVADATVTLQNYLFSPWPGDVKTYAAEQTDDQGRYGLAFKTRYLHPQGPYVVIAAASEYITQHEHGKISDLPQVIDFQIVPWCTILQSLAGTWVGTLDITSTDGSPDDSITVRCDSTGHLNGRTHASLDTCWATLEMTGFSDFADIHTRSFAGPGMFGSTAGEWRFLLTHASWGTSFTGRLLDTTIPDPESAAPVCTVSLEAQSDPP